MFLADIEFDKEEYNNYDLFHMIISDFRNQYDLTIIDIQNIEKKLEYKFYINDIDEDEILHCSYHVKVSFSRRLNFIIVTLEATMGTFSKFIYMHNDLESISGKYLKNKL